MRNPPEPAAFDVVRAYTAFGPFLRYLRRRAQLTQSALSVAVGYSPAHISLLEGGQRQPDLTAVAALFLPALGLQEEPELAAQLLRLAAAARGETGTLELTRTVRRQVVVTEVVEAEEARTPRLPPATPRLPAPAVPLIGREQEREELSALLLDASVRLLTLAGPPGVGKSRLALHVAWELQSAFAGGASFLELAAVQEAALVATTVMQGLGITGGSGETGAETAALRAALRDQELLLVLDNFEQVLPAASLVADLLAAAPRLKILVTSREALRLYGEHLVAVPPLPLPDLAEIPPPDELAHVPSVALFVARARAVRPGFALTASNAPAVAAICVRLDGLPLAIELAAAQSRLFAPQELAARLIRQEPRGHAQPATLQVLARGAWNLPRRQQSLEAAIEWSYRLLEPDEQALLARLGVFSGGFDLLAIEGCGLQADGSVLEEGPSTASRPEAAPNRSALHSRSAPKGFNPQPSTQERLRSLVDKSLVQVTAGEPTRFTLLEILREYALEQLAARGELDEARRRHAEYFTTLAEETLPHLFEAGEADWLAGLRREHDNLRAALRWACDARDLQMGWRLGASLWWFWYRQGALSEGRAWLEKLLALPWSERGAQPETLSLRAKVFNGAGAIAAEQRDYASAERYHTEAVGLRRLTGDARGLSVSLHNLGLVAREQGDFERALRLLDESLAYDRQAGSAYDLSLSLTNLGITAAEMGDASRAEAWLDEAVVVARTSASPWCLGFALLSLSDLKFTQGAYDEARRLAAESLGLFAEQDDRLYLADALKRLGQVAARRGHPAEARARLEEALAVAEEIGDQHRAAECRAELVRLL